MDRIMAARSRQQRCGARDTVWLTICGAAIFAIALAFQVHAATTERVVSDRYTGLAISGFDPVAYFTDAAARLGLSDYEITSSGVTWRFRNEGNMAAFAADPEIYAPQFGGYDPIAVARGAPTAGHPQVFFIHEKRLYLFQSSETLEQFAADPAAARNAALEKWPEVERELVP
jgi:YHS domain-containing protein